MAPTFDADKGRGGLSSLWEAGQDLIAAAATRSDRQRDLDAAQDVYTAAYARAVATGWSPDELRELGLPRPDKP
ncbi:hypothetical protein [Pengzhenrongella sp.]|uniref:hypothetical protein n=1 Tax=Pengzhenrongella sp. TaxID=2888820 RepID=UPI002F91F642